MAPRTLFRNSFLMTLACLALAAASAAAQQDIVPFDSDRWNIIGGAVVDHLGRKSLRGAAILKDVVFENGVIEVDVAFDGSRNFAGFVFRMQPDGSYEEFYLRPHKSNQPDALQYTPVFKGLGSWQLYSGPGYTAAAPIPHQRWIHLKMEISGTQARVYLDDAAEPALEIPRLQLGAPRGSIGVKGPDSAAAHFSNFRYTTDAPLSFTPPPQATLPEGAITRWELSQPFHVSRIDRERSPADQPLGTLQWQKVTADSTGLVDIGRHVSKNGQTFECVIARTSIPADVGGVRKLLFGYSDEISIFLNGVPLFRGNSEFRRRDPQFQGIIGLNDAVFLNLKEGENELLFIVSETLGGWGFSCALVPPEGKSLILHRDLTPLWTIDQGLGAPESAVYDPARDVFYIVTYISYAPGKGTEFISKVKPDGEIEQLKWVTGLSSVTGGALWKDRLYVSERNALVEIDAALGKIIARYPAPGARFLNDVVIDPQGTIYASDSQGGAIYRFADGKAEEWLRSPELAGVNGLWLDRNQGRLIVGASGTGCFRAVELETRRISVFADLGAGSVLDGIHPDGEGNYLIGDWNGRLYRLSPDGNKTVLIDSREAKLTLADFEYVPEKKLLVVPTLFNNSVLAFRLDRK